MDKSTDILIDKYVNDTANAEEVIQIENLINNNKVISDEVRFRQNIKAVATKADEDHFKSALEEISGEAKTSKPIKTLYWIFAAAAIVAIGFFGYDFWSVKPSEDLFSKHFEPYRNVVSPVVRGETEMDSLSQAFFYYENKNYDKALSYFEILEQQDKNSILEFYQAMVLIEKEKYKDAYQLLESYSNTTKPKLLAQSLWYKALLNIRKGDIEKAKIQLEDLIDLGNFKTSAAEHILQDL